MSVASYLSQFLDGTPLSIERIKLAWPDLPICDRAFLLESMSNPRKNEAVGCLHRHRLSVIDLGLNDSSAYIRYLAVKHVFPPLKPAESTETVEYLAEVARFQKICTDAAVLVRFANNEWSGGIPRPVLRHPESFWAQPQQARLADVSGGPTMVASDIAKLLRYAVDVLLIRNAVTIDEISDVLLQYLLVH